MSQCRPRRDTAAPEEQDWRGQDDYEMREGFTEMRAGFATQATGMTQITALLTKIAD